MTMLQYCHIQGKVRYPTYYAAARVLRVMLKKAHHIGGCIYRCPHCHDWHLTHYTDILEDNGSNRPNKKLRKSRRNRNKNKCITRHNLPKIEFIPMTIKLLMPKGIDQDTFALEVSNRIGIIKLIMGVWINVAHTIAGDAHYQMRNSGLYRQAIKQAVNNIADVRNKTDMNMFNPPVGEIRPFDIESFAKSFRDYFGDGCTKEMYIEFWQGVGGTAYHRYGNYVHALTHKYELYLQRLGMKKDVKALALAMTAAQMYHLCNDTLDGLVTSNEVKLPPFTPGFPRLVYMFRMTALEQAWTRVVNEAIRVLHLGEMNAREEKDIKLASDTITSYFLDMYIIKGIEADTVAEYSEIFDTRAQHVKALDRANRQREAVVKSTLKFLNEEEGKKNG